MQLPLLTLHLLELPLPPLLCGGVDGLLLVTHDDIVQADCPVAYSCTLIWMLIVNNERVDDPPSCPSERHVRAQVPVFADLHTHTLYRL